MARYIEGQAKAKGLNVSFIDLRALPLPLCDGETVYEDPNVKTITQQISDSDAVIVAVPIYNYNAAASAKNLLEVSGYSLRDKLVGVISASGSPRGYLGVMPLITSLLVDFGAWVVPRSVSGVSSSFSDDQIHDQDLVNRLDDFLTTLLSFQKKKI